MRLEGMTRLTIRISDVDRGVQTTGVLLRTARRKHRRIHEQAWPEDPPKFLRQGRDLDAARLVRLWLVAWWRRTD